MDLTVVLPKYIDKVIQSFRKSGMTRYELINIVMGRSHPKLDEIIGLGNVYDKFLDYCREGEENRKNLFYAITDGYDVEPDYISFEEAMAALRKGKTVSFHTGINNGKIQASKFLKLDCFDSYSWNQLCEEKWSITEE